MIFKAIREVISALCLAVLVITTAATGNVLARDARSGSSHGDHLTPEQKEKIQDSIDAMLKHVPQPHAATKKQGIPVNFPVPVYPSNVVSTNFLHTTKGPARAKATIVTTDPPNTALMWYQGVCKKGNWTTRVPSGALLARLQKNGRVYLLNALKGRESLTIECMKSPTETETLISINWALKPKPR